MSAPVIDVEAWADEMYESGWCQRMRRGLQSWRHVSEGGFDQRQYSVKRIAYRDAKAFVLAHHYSGSYAQARLRYGLVHGDRLVGVATLGNAMQAKVLTNPLPTLDQTTAAELARLVLLDEVPGNAESWFSTRVLADALQEGVRGVVAFSDPLPRTDMPGHVGTIYQAMNADYCGRATARPLVVLPDGAVLTDRALQKVRGEEQGAGGVIRRMVAAGARPYGQPHTAAAWLRLALDDVAARRRPHPGNHRFVFRLGRTARERRRIALGAGYEPRRYPKVPDPAPAY